MSTRNHNNQSISGSFTIKINKRQEQYEIQAIDLNDVVVAKPHLFTWLPNLEQKKTLRWFQHPRLVQGISLAQLTSLGQAMYRAVFTPNIATAFGRVQAKLNESDGIRIRLLVEPPELAHLPWEIMHDEHDFIALRSNSPLVRGTKDSIKTSKINVSGKLKILYAWANPATEIEITGEKSAEEIKNLLMKNKKIQFDILERATLAKLQAKLDQGYHILCFAGHASSNSIYLEKDNAVDADQVTSLNLARALEGKAQTRLVFLAACQTAESKSEQMSFSEHLLQDTNKTKAPLPSVVAMQYAVRDDQTNPLMARFFEALASFKPIDVALSEARKSILQNEEHQRKDATRDVFAPILYLQSESSDLFRKARNWPAIGFAVAFIIAALLGFIALSNAINSSMGETEARATAVAEATQRAYAEAQAVVESESRALAEIERDAKAREALSMDLAKLSTDALQQHDIQNALGYAIQAVEVTYKVDGTYTGAAEAALYQALIDSSNPILTGSSSSDLTGSPLMQIRDETGLYPVYVAQFSPDGNYILTSKGADAGLWNIQGNLEVPLEGVYGSDLLSASFANNGSFFVTRELLDDVLRVWNANGQLQVEFCTEVKTDCDSNAHEDDVEGFSISPDGKYIVTIHNSLPVDGTESTAGGKVQEGSARLWTVNGQFISEMKGHTDAILEAQFFPDSLEILTSSRDGTAQIWDLYGNSLLTLEHGEPINMAIISPDGKHIGTAGDDGKVNIWDRNGTLYQTLYHENSVESVQFSSNNFHIVTITDSQNSADDTPARLWDINGNLITSFSFDYIYDAIFTPDGTKILTLSSEIQIWDLEGHLIKNYEVDLEESPTSANFSSDGRRFLTASRKGVWVWNINDFLTSDIQSAGSMTSSSDPTQNSGAIVGEDDTSEYAESSNTPLATLNGHTAYISQIVYSPTQKQFITLPSQFNKDDGNIFFWDENGNLITVFQGEPNSVVSAEFNSDGTRILTVNDGKVRLWQNDGSLIAVLGQTDNFNVHGILWASFNETGENIVTIISGVAYLWDSNGNLIATLNQTTNNIMGYIWRATFSPDGYTVTTIENNSNSSTVSLWDMNGSMVAILEGHQYSIYDTIFSPDGQRILTRADEGELRLWDSTGNLIAELEGHQSPISNWAFSISGQLLATGDSDGNAFLWDYQGEKIGAISSGSYQFNLDGTRLLTTGHGEAQLWDNKGNLLDTYDELSSWLSLFEPTTNRFLSVTEDSHQSSLWDTDGNLIKNLDEHIDNIQFTSFSSDGAKFITGDGHTTCLWDINGELIASIDIAAHYAEFSRDSSKILLTTEDNVQLWDVAGNLLNIFTLRNETTLSVANFNPTETRILATTDNNSIEMWKMEHFTPIEPGHPVQVRFQDISTSVVEFSPSGQLIFTTSNDWLAHDFVAYLWDKNGNKLMSFEGHNQSIEAIAISSDENLFVTADRGGVARLWERNGTLLAVLEGHTANVFAVIFNANGTRILTVSDDATARLWDTQGYLISVLDGYINAGWPGLLAGFSPNGKFVVTAGCEKSDALQSSKCLIGTVHLWDSNDGNLIANLPGLDKNENTSYGGITIDSLAFSPDGTRFTVNAGGWLLWDYLGNSIPTLEDREDSHLLVNTISYSPNGEYFIAAGSYFLDGASIGRATIWNSTGNIESVIDLKKDNTDIISAHFDGSSDHVVTSHEDRISRLWDIDGTLIATLDGGMDAIFSPTGDRIATISEDGIVRLWGRTGSLLFAIQGHSTMISSVTFNADGTRLITVDKDGIALLWDIYPNINEMLIEAKKRLSTFIPDYSECYTDDTREQMPECFEAVYEECLAFLGYTGCGESQGYHIGAEYQVNGTFKFNDPPHIWQFDREETAVNLSLRPSENLDLILEVYDTKGQLIDSSDSGLAGNIEHIDGITLQTGYTIVIRRFNENESGDYVLFTWPSDE